MFLMSDPEVQLSVRDACALVVRYPALSKERVNFAVKALWNIHPVLVYSYPAHQQQTE